MVIEQMETNIIYAFTEDDVKTNTMLLPINVVNQKSYIDLETAHAFMPVI